jgi:erythromycin esterase
MRFRAIWLATSLSLLPLGAATQPAYFNLDFETATRGRLWVWNQFGPGYEFALDTSVVVSGRQSLRIHYLNGEQRSTATQNFPPEAGRGKRIRFSGFMKTDGITEGNAALWLRVDGPGGLISLDNAPFGTGSGTTDWRNYVIERDVSPDATSIVFGVFQFGNGTAWFDNFAIEVDGVPYVQAAAPNPRRADRGPTELGAANRNSVRDARLRQRLR